MTTELSNEERIARLERQNRNIKRACIVLAIMVVGVLPLALSVRTLPSGPQVLKVRELQLVDAQGKARADLGVTTDGQVGLVLFDEKGGRRVALSLIKEGPGLTFFDDQSRERASFCLVRNDSATLGFIDKQGKPRVGLTCMNTRAALELYDTRGTPSAMLAVLSDGPPAGPVFGVFGADSAVRALLCLGPDGSPMLSFFDRHERRIWSAP